MSSIRWLFPLVVMALGACDATVPPASPSRNAPSAGTSAMEFRGERPCADCDGIQAWLRLEQEGGARRYRLIERYRSGARERRFEDEGDWQADGDVLRLRSRGGGERVYAQRPDGSLQARDAHARPLPEAADEVMLPVTFDSMQ